MALAIALMPPLPAQPLLKTFNPDDSGTMGCQGQAATPQGAQASSHRM